jgi:hypothetical protein
LSGRDAPAEHECRQWQSPPRNRTRGSYGWLPANLPDF